jgi:hypothetical protein
MAEVQVGPAFFYDATAGTLRIVFPAGDLPAKPPGVRDDLWIGGVGPTAEFTVNVRRNALTTPVAYYFTDADPPVRMQVTYSNGAWQMPGTPAP